MPIAVEPPTPAGALAPGVPLTILPQVQIQAGNTREMVACLIDNDTGYFFMVSFNGQTQWLQAWTSALFGVDRNNPQVTLTPQSTVDPANTGQVTATYYLVGDQLPGLYPQSLGRAAVATAPGTVTISGVVEVEQVFPAVSNPFVTIPQPAQGSPLDSVVAVTNADTALFSAAGIKRFVVSNPDANATLWLGYGHAAVAGSGIAVFPKSRYVEERYNGGTVHGVLDMAGPVNIGYQTF